MGIHHRASHPGKNTFALWWTDKIQCTCHSDVITLKVSGRLKFNLRQKVSELSDAD